MPKKLKKNLKENVDKKEVEDKPHLSLVVDGGHRPLKPGFHLAMVLTLLTQHQLVISKNVHIHIYERGLSYLKMFTYEHQLVVSENVHYEQGM